MTMALAAQGFLEIKGMRLEYRFCGPQPDESPTIVLLHEGLGSAGLWGDFPDKLSEATGAGIFAYSRAGYGTSSAVNLPRPLTYMHDEALVVLGSVLDAVGFREGILLGHSDGGSIATIYGGGVRDTRVKGLCLMAPHFFVEDISVALIREVKEAYDQGDLRSRLARWHAHVDCAFRGWNDAWLDPTFRAWNICEFVRRINVPLLLMQGEDDQYGTRAQIEVVQRHAGVPATVILMPGVRHSPHRERPVQTLEAVCAFFAERFPHMLAR